MGTEDMVMPTYGIYVPPAVIDAAIELGDDGARFLFAVVSEMYESGPVEFERYRDEDWYPTFIVAVESVDPSTGPSLVPKGA